LHVFFPFGLQSTHCLDPIGTCRVEYG
jgi:hypothetical protein